MQDWKTASTSSGKGGRQRRTWWKKKRWWVAGLLVALIICIEFIPRFPFGPYTLYADLTPEQRAAKIPYEMLSSEETRPFSLPFLHIQPDHPTTQAAIRRWTHVRECLVESEHASSDPDLRLIDWSQFESEREAQVCLFRIFDSLATLPRIDDWARFHNFEMDTKPLVTAGATSRGYHRSIRGFGLLIPDRGFTYLLWSIIGKNHSIGVRFEQNGKLIGVSAGKTHRIHWL